MVNSLIGEQELQWKEDIIRKIFPEDIAGKIIGIPLSSDGCRDFASWPHTKSGIYTVRSAYNLATTQIFWEDRSIGGKGTCSDQNSMKKAWKKLWAIQCPNKMKVILWRIAHDCLPTGKQLQVRSIQTRYDCHLCNR
jgi:hypothetical protein